MNKTESNLEEFDLEESKERETALQYILRDAERRKKYHGFRNHPGYKNKEV